MEPRARDSDSGLLSLCQIQTVHSCNEYTESPTTWPHPQISDSTHDEDAVPGPNDHTPDSSLSPGNPRMSTEYGPSSGQVTLGQNGETVVKEQVEKFEQELQIVTLTEELCFVEDLGKRMSAVEEQPRSLESKRVVLELGFSEQGNLGSEVNAAIQEQPKSHDSKQDEMMPFGSASTDQKHLKLEPKQETTKQHRKHPDPCDHCSRCKCRYCTSATPPPLPSCWLCGRRCLCSPETVVEYSTCVCCLKALLYHCCSDDEDSSADAPFSCHESRRCTRWSIATAMALILPCLLCYAPARACLALCKLCRKHAHRTGCRCRSQHVTHYL